MAEPNYNGGLSPDAQVSMEEWIAARIFDAQDGCGFDEEACAQLGRDILLEVLKRFRSDLVNQDSDKLSPEQIAGALGATRYEKIR